jgi:hypothetical protein
MEYVFIAPIHFLKISSTLNKGNRIIEGDNLRISNGGEFIYKLMRNSDILRYAGLESCNEFDSTYIYSIGKAEDIYTGYDGFSHGDLAFLHLRISSLFLAELWSVCDHSAYVRDGFFFTIPTLNQPNKIDQISKASLSFVHSKSNGRIEETVFSIEEIKEAARRLTVTDLDQSISKEYLKYPKINPFEKGLDRVARAEAFITMARSSPILPLKIYNYCTALECLFNTDASEISHKIAERTALLLGDSSKEKYEIFDTIKDAYSVRSKSTHGKIINKSNEHLIHLSECLDNLLRSFFHKFRDNYPSAAKDERLSKYYNELIFNINAKFPE